MLLEILSGVNSFAERYRVDSSDPTTSLDAGDLVFNTSASALKYYDGSAWNAIVAGSMTDLDPGHNSTTWRQLRC